MLRDSWTYSSRCDLVDKDPDATPPTMVRAAGLSYSRDELTCRERVRTDKLLLQEASGPRTPYSVLPSYISVEKLGRQCPSSHISLPQSSSYPPSRGTLGHRLSREYVCLAARQAAQPQELPSFSRLGPKTRPFVLRRHATKLQQRRNSGRGTVASLQ